MTATDNPGDAIRGAMAQNLDAARKAMENYFQFVEKALTASPMGANHPAQALCKYIQNSVEASFDLSDKLLHAHDLQDVLKIQTEFFQSRMSTLAEQTRDFRDAASKVGLTGAPPTT
jgi:hypothetical protein